MTRLRRRTRRALVGLAAVPLVAAGVLAVEVQMARTGPDLPDDTPLDHDGRIGGGGGDGAGPALHMVWLGDSTAAGVGASGPDTALPRRVARALDRPVDVTSLAVSGARVADVLSDQVPHLQGLHLQGLQGLQADVVLVSIGANDVVHLTSQADFRRRYLSLIERVDEAAPGAVLVLLGVPDMGAPPRLALPLRWVAAARGRQLDDVAEELARAVGAVRVDIAGETGPVMRSDTARYFARDRYHPSDDGYGVWTAAVLEQLVPALQQRKSADAGR